MLFCAFDIRVNAIFFQGRQFPDANLPGVPPDQTKAIFEDAIRTLVQLQSVDTDRIQLAGIGDKENCIQERVKCFLFYKIRFPLSQKVQGNKTKLTR